MGEFADEDTEDIEEVVEQAESLGLVPTYDEALVRYIATLLVKGKSESEIWKTLNENSLVSSRVAPQQKKSLMSQAEAVADEIRWMVVSKAEMEDVEQQRIDSYARRKRALSRLEAVIESAHGQADSVGKLNQVSFMVGGLIKAQESLDKFTGAQDAVPQVVVNVGYDPLQQFREVVQQELNTIDIEPDSEEDDSSDS
jgi:hypothetical protein